MGSLCGSHWRPSPLRARFICHAHDTISGRRGTARLRSALRLWRRPPRASSRGEERQKAAFFHFPILSFPLLLLLATPSLPRAGEGASVQGQCLLEPGPAGTVSRVTGGPSLTLEDGREVSLPGALSPSPSPGGGAVPPAVATALQELVLGRSVKLGFPGPQEDRYGRLLAQVFVEGTGGARVWVQGELLRRGLARAYGLPGNFACMTALLAHERVARRAGAGFWSRPEFRLLDAAAADDLLRHENEFVIVAGTVTEAAIAKDRLYLNFGLDWRQDFTASAVLGPAFPREEARRLAALAGQRVEVRGWLGERDGPHIELWHPAQVQAAEAPGP